MIPRVCNFSVVFLFKRPDYNDMANFKICPRHAVKRIRHWSAAYAYVDLDVRLTYKRRYARSPPFPVPPPSFSPINTYYGNTTFCDAGQLSPNHPHSRPFHHQRPHRLRTCCGGASLCLLLPPPTVYPFVHSSERTYLDRLRSFKSGESRTAR